MLAWKTTVRKNQTITALRGFDYITHFFRIVKSVGPEPIFELALIVWALDPNNVPMSDVAVVLSSGPLYSSSKFFTTVSVYTLI